MYIYSQPHGTSQGQTPPRSSHTPICSLSWASWPPCQSHYHAANPAPLVASTIKSKSSRMEKGVEGAWESQLRPHCGVSADGTAFLLSRFCQAGLDWHGGVRTASATGPKKIRRILPSLSAPVRLTRRYRYQHQASSELLEQAIQAAHPSFVPKLCAGSPQCQATDLPDEEILAVKPAALEARTKSEILRSPALGVAPRKEILPE